MPSVVVLNGPNLNLLGVRRPEVYGTATLAEIEDLCRQEAAALGLDIELRQSNHEGQLVLDPYAFVNIGPADDRCLKSGGLTHTSVALHDAIEGTRLPVIEVHISQLHQREDFRHHSYISLVARGIIIGLGAHVYGLGIQGLHRIAETAD
jgi:3-dehydroquinate dehydratase-2